MKKTMMAIGAILAATAVNAEVSWSWWVGGPKKDSNISGCQLGVASECAEIKGAQVSLLWNRCKELRNGAQAAFGYNNARKVQNGPQVAVVNIADKAALQFGLLCFNKGGFLPFFVFFNFDKTMFGGGDK